MVTARLPSPVLAQTYDRRVVTTTFPGELLDLQRELHKTRTEYDALCATLPSSVVPLDGWTIKSGTAAEDTVRRPPSPGYTDEQLRQERDLFARLRELSIQIVVHPFWATLQGPERVAARTELKHTGDHTDDHAGADTADAPE